MTRAAAGAQLLYIVGSGRSGSSLLDVLLGLHSEVIAAGEVSRLSKPSELQCPCGSMVDRCPHWSAAGQRLGLDGNGRVAWERLPLAFDVGSLPHTLPEAVSKGAALFASKALLERTARVNESTRAMLTAVRNSWMLYDALSEVHGATWVVDSSKTGGRLRLLAEWEPSRVRALHLVRDGRGVTASRMRHYDVPMRRAVLGWMRMNLVAEAVMRELPDDRKLRIRYEDCVADPAAIGRIFRFMELEEEPVLDRLADVEIHSLPGSPSLYNFSRRVTPDERWRTELSPDDLATFDRIGGWLNRRYGYAD